MAKYQVYGVRHTYIEYNNVGTLAYKRAWLTKECEIKVSNQKLEFAGDGVKLTRNYGYSAEGSVMSELEDDQLDNILWGLTAVAPGGGDDFAKRYYHGQDAEIAAQYVGVRISLDATDADTGAVAVIRYRILRCLFDPDAPDKFASQAVAGRKLSFQAYQTKTDVAGAALTSVPSRGAFWTREFITNSNNFDPVPGEIL